MRLKLQSFYSLSDTIINLADNCCPHRPRQWRGGPASHAPPPAVNPIDISVVHGHGGHRLWSLQSIACSLGIDVARIMPWPQSTPPSAHGAEDLRWLQRCPSITPKSPPIPPCGRYCTFTEDFKAGYDEHCEKQYGFFHPVVDEVVEEYLRCRDLHEGFARVRCTNPECKHECLLTFSCKGRWFCPSCHSKKTIQFAEDATNNIRYPFQHRQFVFSIAIMLRMYFKYDRKLLTKLCHCSRDSNSRNYFIIDY